MKRKYATLIWLLNIIAMLVLIFDSRTAITGAKEGINLCLQSVIPSLFPFVFLSGILTVSLSGVSIPFLSILGDLLRIPHGSEMLVILGFLGGYPVGAQNVCNTYRSQLIDRETARRMLIFCNNAGPAFIFGIVAPQLNKISQGWYLWGILILSSLVTGFLLPGHADTTAKLSSVRINASQTLTNTVKAMSCICGWVVLFRVFLLFAEKWLLDQLPSQLNVLITGLIELTNGCVQLRHITDGFERFAISVVLLSFGGACVAMQTTTAAATLGMCGYLPGKMLQSSIGYILCLLLRPILFPGPMRSRQVIAGMIAVITAVLCVIYFKHNKEYSRFSRKNIVYCPHRSLL